MKNYKNMCKFLLISEFYRVIRAMDEDAKKYRLSHRICHKKKSL